MIVKRLMAHKAKQPQPIVGSDQDNARFREHGTPTAIGTLAEAAPVDPDHHRCRLRIFGAPYIQIQAAFIHLGRGSAIPADLRRHGTERRGVRDESTG